MWNKTESQRSSYGWCKVILCSTVISATRLLLYGGSASTVWCTYLCVHRPVFLYENRKLLSKLSLIYYKSNAYSYKLVNTALWRLSGIFAIAQLLQSGEKRKIGSIAAPAVWNRLLTDLKLARLAVAKILRWQHRSAGRIQLHTPLSPSVNPPLAKKLVLPFFDWRTIEILPNLLLCFPSV